VGVTAGRHHFVAIARPRTLSDLTTGFWLSLVAGSIAALAGLWVWVLRPRAWAPVMFALSGVGLFVGCATIALNISAGLGLNGTIDQAMLVANYTWGQLCSGTIVALFARFPLPLVRPFWLWLLAITCVLTAIDVTFDCLPGAVDLAIVTGVIHSGLIVLLLGLQAWHVRSDPDSAAAFRPIAIGAGISVVLFCVLTLAGQWDGGKPLASPDMTAPLLLMVYLGLGIAIIRARLFALGRWALGMLLSACAILLFLVLDAILLATVTEQRDLAFFVSAALGATVYLPMREWMLRRAERLRDGQTRDLLQFAGKIALALTPQAASDAWHAAVIAMFEPLELVQTPFLTADPEIQESGSALYLPAPNGRAALLLRYPGGGARMFGPPDLETAVRFGELIRQLTAARDAYMRGVTEERSRIARDLHDDVSARLLTSLHRNSAQAIQQDVRSAMADIRTIVTGLSGTPQSLHALLANLRHETQARLEAANIALDWPLTSAGEESCALDYVSYRHILSIVRECVSNIIRHAAASEARIIVDIVGSRLVVEISDNGSGLSPHAPHGNGLLNAARRAESLDGTFEIIPGPAGMTACLNVPLSHPSMKLGLA
jgi:signal transduction histidine kinase